ncbi:MAG: hypothetical protein WCG93_08530 [Paludibacter sp.]
MNQKEKQNESVLSSISNIKEKRADKSSHFELPLVTGLPPEGFITGEEFWKISRENLDNTFRKHGLL